MLHDSYSGDGLEDMIEEEPQEPILLKGGSVRCGGRKKTRLFATGKLVNRQAGIGWKEAEGAEFLALLRDSVPERASGTELRIGEVVRRVV